jgi:hypothetical protein
MKYVVDIVSGGMIYIPSFTMTGSTIQKFIGSIPRHTDMLIAKAYFIPTK